MFLFLWLKTVVSYANFGPNQYLLINKVLTLWFINTRTNVRPTFPFEKSTLEFNESIQFIDHQLTHRGLARFWVRTV